MLDYCKFKEVVYDDKNKIIVEVSGDHFTKECKLKGKINISFNLEDKNENINVSIN